MSTQSVDDYYNILDRYGTPVYVTDLNTVSDRYLRLRNNLPQFNVKYATKANFDPLVVSELDRLGVDFVAGSAFEADFISDHGIEPSSLQVTAVCPSDESIKILASLSQKSDGFTVTVNEYDSLFRLLNSGFEANILLRKKPDETLRDSSKYDSGSNLKFGLTENEIDKSIKLLDNMESANLLGFHSHLGGSFLNNGIDRFCEHGKHLAEWCIENNYTDFIQEINIGGGLGIPYKEEQEELNIQKLNRELKNTLPNVDADYVIEPGRYVVAPSTRLLTEVVSVRNQNDSRFVGVDAGMSQFPRTAMFDVYHQVSNLSNTSDKHCKQTVAGPTCSGADIFCNDRTFGSARMHDILSIEDTGAYGFVLSSNFHSYPSPTIVDSDGNESPVSKM